MLQPDEGRLSADSPPPPHPAPLDPGQIASPSGPVSQPMPQRRRRRIAGIALVATAAVLLAGGLAWRWLSSSQMQPWQFLAHVEQIEAAGVDAMSVQPLGWSLAILGRDDEVRRLDMHPQF